MIIWLQYFLYLAVGALYYMLLASYFTVAAGSSILPVFLIIAAIVLGGFVSGLSFIYRYFSAGLGGLFSLIFSVFGLYLFLFEDKNPILAGCVVLAIISLAVSVLSIRDQNDFLWRKQKTAIKVIVVVLGTFPLVFILWTIFTLVS